MVALVVSLVRTVCLMAANQPNPGGVPGQMVGPNHMMTGAGSQSGMMAGSQNSMMGCNQPAMMSGGQPSGGSGGNQGVMMPNAHNHHMMNGGNGNQMMVNPMMMPNQNGVGNMPQIMPQYANVMENSAGEYHQFKGSGQGGPPYMHNMANNDGKGCMGYNGEYGGMHQYGNSQYYGPQNYQRQMQCYSGHYPMRNMMNQGGAMSHGPPMNHGTVMNNTGGVNHVAAMGHGPAMNHGGSMNQGMMMQQPMYQQHPHMMQTGPNNQMFASSVPCQQVPGKMNMAVAAPGNSLMDPASQGVDCKMNMNNANNSSSMHNAGLNNANGPSGVASTSSYMVSLSSGSASSGYSSGTNSVRLRTSSRCESVRSETADSVCSMDASFDASDMEAQSSTSGKGMVMPNCNSEQQNSNFKGAALSNENVQHQHEQCPQPKPGFGPNNISPGIQQSEAFASKAGAPISVHQSSPSSTMSNTSPNQNAFLMQQQNLTPAQHNMQQQQRQHMQHLNYLHQQQQHKNMLQRQQQQQMFMQKQCVSGPLRSPNSTVSPRHSMPSASPTVSSTDAERQMTPTSTNSSTSNLETCDLNASFMNESDVSVSSTQNIKDTSPNGKCTNNSVMPMNMEVNNGNSQNIPESCANAIMKQSTGALSTPVSTTTTVSMTVSNITPLSSPTTSLVASHAPSTVSLRTNSSGQACPKVSSSSHSPNINNQSPVSTHQSPTTVRQSPMASLLSPRAAPPTSSNESPQHQSTTVNEVVVVPLGWRRILSHNKIVYIR